MQENRNGLAPGASLGSYRIEHLVGRGGMGAVFQAYDTKLHRQVALKVLDDDGQDAQLAVRLLREARNAAALNHPHICTVHEVGNADGVAFIAMEYVGGRSLRDRIDEGRLPLEEVMRLGIQAADALAYAHEHGVVHRDFKAANAILTEDGRLKIVDFGLAHRDDVVLASATTMASLVPADTAAGTPYAMAPEQVRGESADARTDIWALGVLLYEMVTGSAPFTGATLPELFAAILTKPPGTLPDRVAAEIRVVVERCLAKDPARRYAHASEVRAALEAIRAGTVAPWVSWGYHLNRRPWLALAAGLLIIGAVLVGFDAGGMRHRLLRTAAEPAPFKLAVLPLEDLSPAADQDYFVAGMHDALITDLARIGAVRVTARASTQRYRGTHKGIAEIAKELNVDAVLTGSIVRAGDRVRVTAQLIDGATEDHLWTDRFDRAVREVLSLQSDIVGAIARSVRLQITPEERVHLARARPVDPEAHEAYLRGTFFLDQSTPEGVTRGLALLNQAVAKDPSHALPYAHLAAGYATLGHGSSPPPEAFDRARAAALKALELDESVALAHTVVAELVMYAERTWDWPAVEHAFERAIELNPTLARAHAHYAWYVALFDRWDEALASMRRAQEVDPLTALWPAWQGSLYWWVGRNDDAIRECQKSLELNPTFPVALSVVGRAYSDKGMHEEAIAAQEQAVALNRSYRWSLAYAYARAGRRTDALRVAAEFKADGGASPNLAKVYAALGDNEEALRSLQAAHEHGKSSPWIRNLHALAPLRTDPRFKELVRLMKLPE